MSVSFLYCSYVTFLGGTYSNLSSLACYKGDEYESSILMHLLTLFYLGDKEKSSYFQWLWGGSRWCWQNGSSLQRYRKVWSTWKWRSSSHAYRSFDYFGNWQKRTGTTLQNGQILSNYGGSSQTPSIWETVSFSFFRIIPKVSFRLRKYVDKCVDEDYMTDFPRYWECLWYVYP